MNSETLWLVIGFLGQSLFFMRFFVQWLASEKAKRSTIPNLFWYFSIGGGVILLSYAIYRQDPVFILGQSMGLLIYARNIYFIRKEKNEAAS
ncbi:MAG: lipid-A-disaccharide synthase N-terminal domain-containing protein [Rhodospirillales bacterium]|nr:lipid-A-disaccharide synthase N-terminal domain-containing protein [Rhodospirillales bacterium]